MSDPRLYQPVDDEVRARARHLIRTSNHASLAVLKPNGTQPSVSRIALAVDHRNNPLSLMSDLAAHTRAIDVNPACALLIGDPEGPGDPLSHPRLTLHCTAAPVARGTADHSMLRDQYLAQRPKAKPYAGFTDFRFVRFEVIDGLLNAGFGRAYLLGPEDLRSPQEGLPDSV